MQGGEAVLGVSMFSVSLSFQIILQISLAIYIHIAACVWRIGATSHMSIVSTV